MILEMELLVRLPAELHDSWYNSTPKQRDYYMYLNTNVLIKMLRWYFRITAQSTSMPNSVHLSSSKVS